MKRKLKFGGWDDDLRDFSLEILYQQGNLSLIKQLNKEWLKERWTYDHNSTPNIDKGIKKMFKKEYHELKKIKTIIKILNEDQINED